MRVARRYRWRLAGGRLVADDEGLAFVPNRLEARRPDTAWSATRADVVAVRRRGRLWVDVETSREVVAFRSFRAADALQRFTDTSG